MGNNFSDQLVIYFIGPFDPKQPLGVRIPGCLYFLFEKLYSCCFRCNSYMSLGHTKACNKGAMVGEHWLIPLDFLFKLGKGLFYTFYDAFHPFSFIRIVNAIYILLKMIHVLILSILVSGLPNRYHFARALCATPSTWLLLFLPPLYILRIT